MANYKTKIRFFTIADYEEEQAWLEDQHRQGWNYFSKPKSQIENESEMKIFSDLESKIEMIDRIFKTRMMPLVIIFCAIIVPNLLRLSSSRSGPRNVSFIITLMIFALYIYIFLHCGLKLKKIKNKLK